MANKEVKNKEVKSKDGFTKTENMVYRNVDSIFDILISTLKRAEIAEYDANEITIKHYPDQKADNPWENLIELCNRYVKHLNSKYMAYLKKNNLKPPKALDSKTCIVQELKQTKNIK